MLTPDTPLSALGGVGPVRAQKLQKLGLSAVGDLLTFYPRTYEDRRRVCTIAGAPEGESVCVEVLVAEEPRVSRIRKGLELTKVKVADGTAVMTVTFFNQSYLRTALHPGEEYVLFGKVEGTARSRQMVNPVVERAGKREVTGCILPVYPLTAGISNHLLLGLVRQAVDSCADTAEETLPDRIRGEYHLSSAPFALRSIHFPASFEDQADAARRLAFEELFYLAAGMALLRGRRTALRGVLLPRRDREEFLSLLPFAPTAAQCRAMEEIGADLSSGSPMNRLVQGDVGSGKTAVAAFAAWQCAKAGAQCAMMAPTELLAEQHYRSLSALLSPAGVRVGLLTGSLSAREKRVRREALARGEIDLMVGTHALLSEGVDFRSLALVITDEQHRFGVAQRAALAAKAATPGAPPQAGRRESGEGRADSLRTTAHQISHGNPGGTPSAGEAQRAALAEKAETPGSPPPHVLVMSATPIPRTLALIIYGDLDVSVLDELPPGRTGVDTFLVGEDKRQRMYGFVRRLVGEGRQAYIVCPAVEEQEEAAAGDAPLKSAVRYAEELQRDVFPDLRVGLLHGRMKPRDKEAVMAAFVRGELDVLVATTVIEVGVDVPNAALMIVENAERFGLSQLHQLRGRVGRGSHKSYCVLLSDTRSEESRRRLKALCATTDGFRIAEEDLKLRGPGDFFGHRQHGLPLMKMAGPALDMRLLKQAQQAAEELLRRDPDLSSPEHAPLKGRISGLFAREGSGLN